MNNRYTHLWLSVSLLIILAIWLTACGGAATADESAVPEYNFPPPIEGVFECSEGDNVTCTIGKNEDVIVVIPWQPEHDSFLYAFDLPINGNLEDFKNEERDEFTPHRLVINFELVIDRNNPEFYISVFNPSIELGVRYVEEDVKAVGGLENLQMGFWDEDNAYWVSFAQHSKYNFSIKGDEAGGYVWVTLPGWGDRYIGCDGR